MTAVKTPQWIIRDQYITLKITLIVDYESIRLLTTAFGDELISLVPPTDIKPVASSVSKFALFTLEYLSAQWRKDNNKIYYALVIQEIHQDASDS